jgi:hypothetical protein
MVDFVTYFRFLKFDVILYRLSEFVIIAFVIVVKNVIIKLKQSCY